MMNGIRLVALIAIVLTLAVVDTARQGSASDLCPGGLCQVPTASDGEPPNSVDLPEFVPGELIVRFQPGAVAAPGQGKLLPEQLGIKSPGIKGLNQRFGLLNAERVFESAALSDVYTLRFPADQDVEAMVKAYQLDSAVKYAEPNYLRQTDDTIPNEYPDWAALAAAQWGLDKIRAPSAWDIQTGSPSVKIAIVDTGVDTNHPDLAANIAPGGYDFVDINTQQYIQDGYELIPGEDYTVRDNNPMDFLGHGTHCAGIAAAATNNGIGIAGTAWNAKILPVRAGFAIKWHGSTVGLLEDDDIAAAIVYAADHGAAVISMSFGGGEPSPDEEDALNHAHAVGSVLVAAAGNSGGDAPHYPAYYDNVIAVAATDKYDQKASFSSYGTWVDVSAPGVGIYSTLFDDTYATWSGTSMATPFVAGLAGLVRSQYPSLSNDEVAARIVGTTDNIDAQNPWTRGLLGSGRINAYKAVAATAGPNITYFEHTIDDSTGDGDGLMDPGEQIALAITLKSKWLDAYNVSATLSENSPYIAITDGQAGFGNMPSGGTADNSADPFMLQVSENILPGPVTFSLNITATDYSGSDVFTITVPTVRIDFVQGRDMQTIPFSWAFDAGDLNGDGIDDIALSDGMQHVYVIFGSNPLPETVDITLGEQDVTIVVPNTGPWFGHSIAAGDFNGDGIDDLLIGYPLTSRPGTSLQGAAYVVFGSQQLAGTIDIGLGQQDLTIYGGFNSDYLGWSAAAGDFNGDGIDDILVGGIAASPPGTIRAGGAAWVIFGSQDLSGTIDIAQGQQDATIYGAEVLDFLGWLEAVGDFNGDGVDDILLGAYQADGPGNSRVQDSGEAYVIFGSPTLGETIDLALGQQDLTIYGANPGENLGKSLTAGDFNGDQVDDILVAAPYARRNSGEAYVVFGSPDLSGAVDIRLGQQDATVIGADAYNVLGESIPGDSAGSGLAATDLNGDGIDDLVLGAAGITSVYVVFGYPTLSGTKNLALEQQHVTIFNGPLYSFGKELAGGDFNGDGLGDILAMSDVVLGWCNYDGDAVCDTADPDDDGDGFRDAIEMAKGSDPFHAGSTPELCDGADNDGDAAVDEGYDLNPVNGVPDCTDPAADTDGDTIANPTDTDDDNDGFSDTAEYWIGTDSLDACPDTGSDDAWPPDINNNRRVDAADIIKFRPVMMSFMGGTGPNDYNYDRRYDLYPNMMINVQDVIKMRPYINTSCTP